MKVWCLTIVVLFCGIACAMQRDIVGAAKAAEQKNRAEHVAIEALVANIIRICGGSIDGGEVTPLFVAVSLGDVNVANTLMQRGANLSKESRQINMVYDEQQRFQNISIIAQAPKRLPICQALRMKNPGMMRLFWHVCARSKKNFDTIEEATGMSASYVICENPSLLAAIWELP